MRATRGRRKCLNAFLFRVKAHQKLSAACASATLGDAELARARPAAVRRTCFVLLDRVLRESTILPGDLRAAIELALA